MSLPPTGGLFHARHGGCRELGPPAYSNEMANLEIRTSTRDWLSRLAAAYQSRTGVTLVDDARLGVDPVQQTLLDMGRRANLSIRDWVAVLVGLGMSGVGAWLIVMAVLDPEPYSKIGAALGAGTVLTLGGGLSSMRVITGHKPPHVRVSPLGFEIRFD